MSPGNQRSIGDLQETLHATDTIARRSYRFLAEVKTADAAAVRSWELETQPQSAHRFAAACAVEISAGISFQAVEPVRSCIPSKTLPCSPILPTKNGPVPPHPQEGRDHCRTARFFSRNLRFGPFARASYASPALDSTNLHENCQGRKLTFCDSEAEKRTRPQPRSPGSFVPASSH